MRIVVVGASLAGVRTVQGLRRRGSDADVVLVGDEPGTSHGVAADRPPLSKDVLADPWKAPTPLAAPEALADLGVRLVTARATDLDLGRRAVVLHGGEELRYDALVLATGSTPRTLPDLEPRPGVHLLRTAADALAVRSAALPGRRVVVVGGGFIGTEVAWTLHTAGCPVTLVEPLPALLVRGLGPELGAAVTRRHVAAGIDVRTGASVATVERSDDRVTGVTLTDGSVLPADVVVLGLGTVPATDWLAGSGLDLRDGVVCDERLAARGAEDVYAVGDLARWHHPRYGEDVRVEHWTNAVETAGVVTANLTGTPTVHDAVPYVWSDQLGSRLMVVGRVRPSDEVRVVHGDLDGAFIALTGGDGRPSGAVGFGSARALVPYRKMLARGATWDEAVTAGA